MVNSLFTVFSERTVSTTKQYNVTEPFLRQSFYPHAAPALAPALAPAPPPASSPAPAPAPTPEKSFPQYESEL